MARKKVAKLGAASKLTSLRKSIVLGDRSAEVIQALSLGLRTEFPNDEILTG
jgi:hypothetical protein